MSIPADEDAALANLRAWAESSVGSDDIAALVRIATLIRSTTWPTMAVEAESLAAKCSTLASGGRPCDECGIDLGPLDPSMPRSTRSWCSTACADKATANEPGWVRVEDLAPAQRAELDQILTPTPAMLPEVARALLDHLRLSEDKPFTNPFGERVWLKHIYDDNGRKSGLTECCLVEGPCDRHAGKIGGAS